MHFSPTQQYLLPNKVFAPTPGPYFSSNQMYLLALANGFGKTIDKTKFRVFSYFQIENGNSWEYLFVGIIILCGMYMFTLYTVCL